MNSQYKSFLDATFLTGVFLLAAYLAYGALYVHTGSIIHHPMNSVIIIFIAAFATFGKFVKISENAKTIGKKIAYYTFYILSGSITGALLSLLDYMINI